MTFNIFMPEDDVNKQRCDPYPAIYFLHGIAENLDFGPQRSGFGAHAKKHGLAMVFPDSAPRSCESMDEKDKETMKI